MVGMFDHGNRNRTALLARRLAHVSLACMLALAAGLASADEEALWNAAWITDTQTPEGEWITTLIARVQANKPKVVIHTGDTRFEWANRCAWRAVMTLLRTEKPPIEFHLACLDRACIPEV